MTCQGPRCAWLTFRLRYQADRATPLCRQAPANIQYQDILTESESCLLDNFLVEQSG